MSAHISRFDFVKHFYVFDFFCLFKNSDCLFSNQTNTSKDIFEAGEPNIEKKTLKTVELKITTVSLQMFSYQSSI